MVDTIKKYKLSGEVNTQLLLDLDFKIDNINNGYKATKVIPLMEDVYLTIYVYKDENNNIIFNEESDINVWDEDFGVRYSPFYSSKTHFVFLDKVIERYNCEMDNLCNKGLFVEKDNEKKLILK